MGPFSTQHPLNADQARQILERAYELSRDSFRYGAACTLSDLPGREGAEYGESVHIARDRRDDRVDELLCLLAELMPTPERNLIKVYWQGVLSEHLEG